LQVRRKKVDSSIIYSIGYDRKESILELEFIDGAVFQYTGVPYREYMGLMDSGSLGKYYLRYIRDIYPAVLVEKGDDREAFY
jgi:hypothetical protein